MKTQEEFDKHCKEVFRLAHQIVSPTPTLEEIAVAQPMPKIEPLEDILVEPSAARKAIILFKDIENHKKSISHLKSIIESLKNNQTLDLIPPVEEKLETEQLRLYILEEFVNRDSSKECCGCNS